MKQVEVNLEIIKDDEGGDLKEVEKNLFVRFLRTDPDILQIVQLDKKDDTHNVFFIVRQIQWLKDKKKSLIQDEYLLVKAENRYKAVEASTTFMVDGAPYEVEVVKAIPLPDLAELSHTSLGRRLVQEGWMNAGGVEEPSLKPKRKKA